MNQKIKMKQINRFIHQHVNPLSRKYKKPIDIPCWNKIYDIKLPIHLDIGCGRGNYLIELAKKDIKDNNIKYNYLGVEIRKPIVEAAQKDLNHLKLKNIYIMQANMNEHIDLILNSLPVKIKNVSIFHPDPWFKKRHHKRRLVNTEFLNRLYNYLSSESCIFIQSDVKDIYDSMEIAFQSSNNYIKQKIRNNRNSLGIMTDRESRVIKNNGIIYRSNYIVK